MVEETKNLHNNRHEQDETKKMKNHLPNFFLSVKPKYIKLAYHHLISNALYLLLIPMSLIILTHLSTLTPDDFIQLSAKLRYNFLTVIACFASIFLMCSIYIIIRPRKVYLVNFACFKPELLSDRITAISRERFMQSMIRTEKFTEESKTFMRKILERSGLGQKTYAPKALLRVQQNNSMAEARKETEEVMAEVVDELLAKTRVNVRDIGILVVNCSGFNPAPSWSAMIVNRYKLRGNILSYNIGGMGCSAGMISIDLAKQLLQVNPNTYALVISTDNLTLSGSYFGDERSMLITNCLFRVGGAAILLSNRSSDRRRSKYQLIHTVRTHKGADDRCYNSVAQKEDKIGKMGISLSKDLMVVAGEALKANISNLGPLVLPMSEQLLFFATLVVKKLFKTEISLYLPDFKLAFEHFCIHAGGRAVLDELEKNLELTTWHMEPSRMTLYRFGNTSSSSLWYELAYTEAKGRIRKDDRTWQIAFGSGFKCNSVVWRALKTINPEKEKNPWIDEIDEFPVEVPKVAHIAI